MGLTIHKLNIFRHFSGSPASQLCAVSSSDSRCIGYLSPSKMRLKHFNIEPGGQIFGACSDPSRLRILNLILANGEMCITDLEQILEFTQTKTSRHLIYLKNSGILTTRKYNQWVFYQIKDEVTEIIQQIFQFLRRDPVLQKDQQVFQTMYNNRELTLNKLKIKPTGQA